MSKADIPKKIKFKEERDGLRLMLMFYRNHGALGMVSEKTGVPREVLKHFCDGEDCLTKEQDKILREPLKEYGSKDVEVSVDLRLKREAEK